MAKLGGHRLHCVGVEVGHRGQGTADALNHRNGLQSRGRRHKQAASEWHYAHKVPDSSLPQPARLQGSQPPGSLENNRCSNNRLTAQSTHPQCIILGRVRVAAAHALGQVLPRLRIKIEQEAEGAWR